MKENGVGQSSMFFVRLSDRRIVNVRYITAIRVDEDGSGTAWTTSRDSKGESVRWMLEVEDVATLLRAMEKRGVIEASSTEH